MYALVKFYDGVHYVCTQKCIFSTKSHGIKVKYSDGYRYSATIIAKNNDKRLLETIVKNINTNLPNVTINPRKKYKTRDINLERNLERNIESLPYASSNKPINCDDPNATRRTDNSKKQCNLNKFIDVSVSYDNAISAMTTCDMSTINNGTTCDISTTNNATANCFDYEKSYDYEKNLEKSSSCVYINQAVNSDKGSTINFESSVKSVETVYQKETVLSTSTENIKETINCDDAIKKTDSSNDKRHAIKKTDSSNDKRLAIKKTDSSNDKKYYKKCNIKKLLDIQAVSYDNAINATTTCDMSTINNETTCDISTTNNATANCTKSYNYEKHIEKSSSCVHINQTINSDEESTINFESNVESTKMVCPKETVLCISTGSVKKTINCDAIKNTDNSNDKRQCNIKKLTDIDVSYDNAINAMTTCDMSATNNGTTYYMSTTNNTTANCKESYDYEKNIEKSCDINKIINLEGGVLNFETFIESSDIDCQGDILVFPFNDDINKTINCDYTSAFKETDNSKKQCNLKELADGTISSDITNATATCDMSAISNRTTICTESHYYEGNIEKSSSCVPINETIHSDERSALNIKTYVEFSKPDYQKEMLDINQNILIDKQIEHVESSPILSDECEYVYGNNVEKCVRRLTFSVNEKLPNEEDGFTDQKQDDNSQTIDTPLFHGNTDEDSEYVPSEHSSFLQDNESTQDCVQSTINKTASSTSSLDISKTVGSKICNDELMYVETSEMKSKRNYCVFCKKLQTQLARHLVTVHRNEPEVKKFAKLPKKHPERLQIIDAIRKNGNFQFNTKAEFNTGQLLVSRRPNEKYHKSATDFTACAKCKGFFCQKHNTTSL